MAVAAHERCREIASNASRNGSARIHLKLVPWLWLFLFVILKLPLAAAEPNGFSAGQLLVAAPEMRDPRFVETVIYMVEHNPEGAFGLVINRPLGQVSFKELLTGFGIDNSAKGEMTIHYGGPVDTRRGFVLHSDDVLLKSSVKTKNGLAATSDPKLLEAIARGKGPKQSLFMFVGYAGWAPGQLEAELTAKAWYVVPADKALIFAGDAEKKWRRALDKRQIPL